MFKRILMTLIMIAMTVSASIGQVAFSSVEEVWKYADDHNLTIRLAKYEATKSGLAHKQSVGALLPSVSASGSYTDNLSLQTTLLPGVIIGKPEGTYVPVQFGQQYIYAAGVTAQMDVLNLQTWFNVRAAKISANMSKDSLANTRKNIYQQLATQYYSVLLMTEAARLAAISESIADSVLTSVTNKYNAGTISKGTVDVAKINLARAQQTSITSQYQIQTAKNNLKALLDMSLSDSLSITGTLQKEMDRSDEGFKDDPSVKLAYGALQISISQYKASNSSFLPTVSVLYSNTRQQNDNKYEPFSSKGPEWYPAQYWSLKASWNLFNGGTRYFQSRRSKITIDERRLQYENAQKQSVINDENLKLNYRKTVALLSKTTDVMQLSLDNYTHVSNKYTEGISSLDDKLNAFSDYINYQNQYLNSLSDMLVQLYQVKVRQLEL